MYYGMRSGHRPFNTPLRFRGKTKVGIVGEMIMEADEIVGRILDQLKESGVDDNTVNTLNTTLLAKSRKW